MSTERAGGDRPVRANLVTFMLLVVLSVIGVGITDYSPADAHRYWIFMVFVCAITSILAGLSQTRGQQRPVSWLMVQVLHWSACVVAMLIVYSLVHTGRINNADAGLILLLLLALTVFLRGVKRLSDTRIMV
jgi:4-amino-4-deoxy-L-arabinose transferase-like glycosyltransferase